jgi:regulator of protease activity HflC (stomatin/prohibitin superfamily)
MPRSRALDLPPRSGRVAVVAGATVVALVALLVLFIMFAAGWRSVPPDKVLLHYTGGPTQGTHFKQIVEPGSSTHFYGLLEHYYFLPATQRNYIISKNADEGDRHQADSIQSPSKDGVNFDFQLAVYFKLNTDPQVVKQFFEQICLKYNCWDLSPDGGWDHMLNDTLRQQIENALQIESRRYSTDDLANNPDVIARIQTSIGTDLKDRFNQVLGGEFFCGPTFNRAHPSNCPDFNFVMKKPEAPKDIRDHYAAVKAAQIGIAEAQADALKKKAEAEGDAARQAALQGAPELSPAQLRYLEVQAEQSCATNPNCTLVVTPGGTNINVQPK